MLYLIGVGTLRSKNSFRPASSSRSHGFFFAPTKKNCLMSHTADALDSTTTQFLTLSKASIMTAE